MTARHSGSHHTFGSRRGPRYPRFPESQQDLSSSHRAFVEHTDGLTGRLRLTGLDGMRAGTSNNPYGLARRFLVAGRTAGLPKAWALRFSVWLTRQVDCLWPLDQTPRRVVEEQANKLEYLDGCAEKRLDLEYNAIRLRERIQTLTNEIVAEQENLAKLEREAEQLEVSA